MDNRKLKLEDDKRGLIYFAIIAYLILFINCINLFALKTGYVGRVSFIVFILVGMGIFIINFIKRYEFIDKDIKIFTILTAIFFCYISLNGIIHGDITRLVYGGYQYILYGMIVFAMYVFLNKKYMKKFLNYVIVFNVINSLICFYEYVARKNFIPMDFGQIAYEGVEIYRGRAFFGSFLNAGVVLSMTVFLALYFCISSYKERNIKKMIMYIICITIHLLGIFSTGSRGPLVGLLAGIAFFIVIYAIVISDNRKKNIIFLGIAFAVGIMALLLILSIDASKIDNPTTSFILHRIQTIFNWSTDPGNVQRIESWQFGLDLFKESPMFGAGIAATGAKGVGSFSLGVTESGVIKKLAEVGIIGFIIIYAQYAYIVKTSVSTIIMKKYPLKQRIFILLLLSAVVSVFVEEFIYQALEAEVVAFYFWTFIALIFKCSKEDYIEEFK